MRIRAAESGELADLLVLERAAGQIFRDVGMAPVAEYPPMSVGELERFRAAGLAWVVDSGGPVAYLVASLVDGCLHIDQVSTHPSYGRRGIGGLLIEHAAAYASSAGLPALTLTTFVDVPWNGPYYARCGFRVLAADEVTPGLRAIREHEAGIGLDRWPRACMRREVA